MTQVEVEVGVGWQRVEVGWWLDGARGCSPHQRWVFGTPWERWSGWMSPAVLVHHAYAFNFAARASWAIHPGGGGGGGRGEGEGSNVLTDHTFVHINCTKGGAAWRLDGVYLGTFCHKIDIMSDPSQPNHMMLKALMVRRCCFEGSIKVDSTQYLARWCYCMHLFPFINACNKVPSWLKEGAVIAT